MIRSHARQRTTPWIAGIGPSSTIRARKALCPELSLGGTPGEGILMSNHPVKAAASLFAALGSRAEVFFLGEARLGGVAAVCDATEGVFDRKRIKCIGIVVARPFFEMGMARMSRVSDRFEQFVEAWDAAAILGRSVSVAPDVARIGDVALAGANIGHGEPMLPAIAEVISVIDDGLPRLEHVAQAHLARFDARLSSPVVIHRQTEPLLTDCEFPEVVIEPPHDDLDDVVQDLERDRGRHST